MMAWTDRHCRYLLRLVSPEAKLFTEMITAAALLHGPRERLLAHDPCEHPVAVQLGGSDPEALAAAAEMAAAAGFDEINLNVGCPSPRVQRGRFGACLMLEPALVAASVLAMRERVTVPVTVKCRLGVDDVDSQAALEDFIAAVRDAGCEHVYVHARKALLSGLSPAENRSIPPLEPARVYALRSRFPDLRLTINGGINSTDEALRHLQAVDGVMVGREAYQHPMFLNELAQALFGAAPVNAWQVMEGYLAYIEAELDRGTRLHDMTRHCLGLFSGTRGARCYRRTLSDGRRLKNNDVRLVHDALGAVSDRVA